MKNININMNYLFLESVHEYGVFIVLIHFLLYLLVHETAVWEPGSLALQTPLRVVQTATLVGFYQCPVEQVACFVLVVLHQVVVRFEMEVSCLKNAKAYQGLFHLLDCLIVLE